MSKLTLVSVRTPARTFAAFITVTMVDGKVRVPWSVIEQLTGPLPRGTTVSVG